MTDSTQPLIHPSLDHLAGLQFEARGFSLHPKQRVTNLLSGRYASRLRGRGLMFEELRNYHAGDDIRTIDWKATARLRRPQVRVYSEERERPVLFVVDQRSSMFFGSARATKSAAAAELTALGGWRVLAAGDRVGAIVFGDNNIVDLKPHRSRGSVLRICKELERAGTELDQSRAANPNLLNEALRHAVHLAKHDFLVVLITDYFGDDSTTQRLATTLSQRNDVLAALVYDPLGISLPADQSFRMSDGTQRLQLALDATSAKAYQLAFKQRVDQLRDRLQSIRIPILPICTHDSVIDQLRNAFGRQP